MKYYTILIMPTWLVLVCCGTIIAQSIMTIISEEIKKGRKKKARALAHEAMGGKA
jgi:hypothetical protein